jgi:hypothetical protein
MAGCLTEGFGTEGFECDPHFAGGLPCEAGCDASDTVTVCGDPYCTLSCGPIGECPPGHICARFVDDPEETSGQEICLPPCNTGFDCPSGFNDFCSQEWGVCGLF